MAHVNTWRKTIKNRRTPHTSANESSKPLPVLPMKKHIDSLHVTLATLFLSLFFAPIFPAQSDDYDHIGTARAPNAPTWGGVRWSKSEMDKFQGRPRMTTDSDTNNYVTVAYDRFVSYYDLKHYAPRWVAYVTDRKSAKITEQKSRTGTDFRRPSEFFTDGVIADASTRLGVQPTEHSDFSDRVPEGLAAGDQVPKTITALKARSYSAIIERGHLAANNTMKTWGSVKQGKKAQYESFSLANVVPQMSSHNAPTWSALEAQCLAWAKELGSVCVVAGPIYNNPAQPRHIQDRRTGEALDIPFADALFCVVIGKRDGKTSAIGFIMPEVTAKYSYKDKAVPIDEIEQATGINFMSSLNEPNPLEETIDQRWMNN